jgi:hypothetical protein
MCQQSTKATQLKSAVKVSIKEPTYIITDKWQMQNTSPLHQQPTCATTNISTTYTWRDAVAWRPVAGSVAV